MLDLQVILYYVGERKGLMLIEKRISDIDLLFHIKSLELALSKVIDESHMDVEIVRVITFGELLQYINKRKEKK